MTTNLESLSDKELDWLAFSMLEIHPKKTEYQLWKGDIHQLSFYEEAHKNIWMKDAMKRDPEYYKSCRIEEVLFIPEKWNPTHKDSNQCERWLFPKLKGKARLDIIFNLDGTCAIEVCGRSGYMFGFVVKDPDQINRTKTICCLKAMEEIG